MSESAPQYSYLRIAEDKPYYFAPATSSPFVADYIAWRNVVSDAASEYAEALALMSLAVIVGANLRIPLMQEPRPIVPNLYMLLLGDSTTARKSTSQKGAAALLEDVFPECIMESPGSPEGFVQDLRDHEKTGAFLVQDEFAGWYASIQKKQYMTQLKDYVLRAYDGDRISRRLRTKRNQDGTEIGESDTVNRPVFSFLANGTPDRIAMLSGSDDIEDGWWPRWAIIWPTKFPPTKPLAGLSPNAAAMRTRLQMLLTQARHRVANPIQATFTDQCWPMIEAYGNQLAGNEDFRAVYERGNYRMIRVATLLALSEDLTGNGDIVVQARHVDDASALVDRWLNSAIRFASKLGNNEFENHCIRVLGRLERDGGETDRRAIAQLIKVNYRYLNDIGQTLQDRGLVELKDYGRVWKKV